jgi:hypothetical protein
MTVITRSQSREKTRVDSRRNLSSFSEGQTLDETNRITYPLYSPSEQTHNPYNVNINFDEASREWMKNKRRMGNGMFKYFRKN